jgi:hypothetical protein
MRVAAPIFFAVHKIYAPRCQVVSDRKGLRPREFARHAIRFLVCNTRASKTEAC